MAEYVLKKMSGLPLLKCEDITGNEFLGVGYLGKNYRLVINELVKYIGDVVSSRGDLPADIVEQIRSITDSIETLSGGFDVLHRDMLSHEGSIALLGAMGIPTYKGEIASGPARLDLYDSLPNPADVNDGNAVYYVSDKGCFYLVVSPGEIAGRGSKAHATFEGSDRYNIGTSSRKDQLFYNESTGFFCRIGDSGMLTVYDSSNSYSNEDIDVKIASIPTCDLGTFDSSTAAWSAAASHNIYGDRTINILTYKIKGDGTTQIIFQQHSVYTTSRANPICTQYMFFEGGTRASYMRTFDLELKEMLSSWSPIHLYSMFEVEDNTVYGYTSPEDLNNKLHKKVALFSINAVTTDTDQDITGKKIFKKDISIDNKSVIAKNIDAGELKVLHNGSTKGFIIRTRKTSDAIYPLELLSTDGYNSYNYGFPAKSGTLLLEEDAAADYALKTDIPSLTGYAKKTDIPTDYVKKGDKVDSAASADTAGSAYSASYADNAGKLGSKAAADYALKTDIPSLTGYAKKTDIPTDYAKTGDNTTFEQLVDITDSSNLMSILRTLPSEASTLGIISDGKYSSSGKIIELPEGIYKNYGLPQRVNVGDLILISKYGLKILPTNTNKERVTYTQEYYDEGNGQVVPVKHPDIATQPNILPYKLAGNYVYEQLLYVGSLSYSIRDGNAEFSMDAPKWEIESPCILKATLITSNGDNGNQVSAPCIASKNGNTIKVCVGKNFVDYKGSISDAWLLIEYSSFSNLNRYYGYGEDDGYDVTLEFYLSGGTIPLPLSESAILSIGREGIAVSGKSKVKLTKDQIKILAEGGSGSIRTGEQTFRYLEVIVGSQPVKGTSVSTSSFDISINGLKNYFGSYGAPDGVYTEKTTLKFTL